MIGWKACDSPDQKIVLARYGGFSFKKFVQYCLVLYQLVIVDVFYLCSFPSILKFNLCFLLAIGLNTIFVISTHKDPEDTSTEKNDCEIRFFRFVKPSWK